MDASSLLAQIARSPADDAPRLAYADWCEASDPARAELIRLQVELSRHLPARSYLGDPDFLHGYRRNDAAHAGRHDLFSLILREYQLLRDNQERWLPEGASDALFERG